MFTTEYIVENLGSVVTAELRMGCCATTAELFHSRAVRFLWEFGTVKSLSMDEFFIAVLRSAGCLDLPTFSNLTSLELCVNYYTDQGMIACLLNICPNLKYLLIREENDEDCLEEEMQISLRSDVEMVPECLLSSLEVIVLLGFHGITRDGDGKVFVG
ncbi:Hypothetical predicted protein [Olea europaea subsp. europaea]|uniref:F-box/LRR-repeat protein n=1 Tax=Olea europaea subsp. europaea TaxID=158383 RepID=A0A8S0UZ65_OLEEU|nr:Hypothetical predicted protein [Olea europaea subsp. europaea]